MSLPVQLIHAARSLMASAQAIVRVSGRDIAVPDLLVFLSIHQSGSATASELTMLLKRDKTTVSRCVSRLTKSGLVEAVIDPFDGRQKNLELTDHGRLVAESVQHTLRGISEKAAKTLSVEEIEAIESYLGQIIEHDRSLLNTTNDSI